MPKILITDDALADRALLAGLLQKSMDCEVIEAADGKDAFAKIESHLPDLVVTDLQMPEMNGLELVSAVKNEFPLIPIILITAKGSEEIAADALKAGAASYVPQHRLAEDLLTTVHRVLIGSRENRVHSQLMHYLTQNESVFEIHNDLGLIESLVSHLQQLLRCVPLGDETELLRVGIALEEALTNAYYHGNLEIGSEVTNASRKEFDELAKHRCYEQPYRSRKIHVTARFSRDEAQFVVRDEGLGFDASRLPNLASTSSSAADATGRGIILMQSIMDQVTFNDRGNQVTMTKLKFKEDEEEDEDGGDADPDDS